MRLTSIKDLISFVDKKEEEVKCAIKRKSSDKQQQSSQVTNEQSMSPAQEEQLENAEENSLYSLHVRVLEYIVQKQDRQQSTKM